MKPSEISLGFIFGIIKQGVNNMFYFDELNGKKILKSDFLDETKVKNINAFFTTRGDFPIKNDFAKRVGISTRTLSNIENGLDSSFSSILRILDGLNLITNLNILVPEKENYIIQEHTEKKRYKKSNKEFEWKWGDEK